ncbi:NAD/NADP-dependent betaine aldehyde dehydrogenase [Lacunisphaera limnophila]|uniref:NAD/NADP-dependent betaine aldehyde dehydrogenase n=1 Tax=Lacunisphaera limnophila TaxID=1838286 RepID=A0A1D8ASL3_9BACT|nr:aldehyde dehydrogenase family protein [Lacunisphaera limnophila]AOS43888.1 NAD/NADP-dependent betaine aldehyde dehydrogenase [Lacunisphaera limnophila]
MTRLPITKTPKVYVGGAFIRSESARTFPLADATGKFFANIPQCTRKDLRNAVEAAAKAGPGWAKRTPYNRGQILYRLAEMLEARQADMADALAVGGARPAAATKEITATIDRLIHYAGWADKYEQVLGSVNPVASPHFNFTVTEPMGIVGVLAPDEAPLLALVSLLTPAITSGNTVVALASSTQPYPAIVLGEMLATSDLPGGVVNLLTGFRKEIVPTLATHTHLRAITGVANADERKTLKLGAADSVKRVKLLKAEDAVDWYADRAQGLYELRDTLEFKTTWHPIGA